MTMSAQATRRGVVEELRRRLSLGDMGPGVQLKVAELSEHMGVGVTPVREALIELESAGWLVSEPGRGFFVPPLSLTEVREIYPIVAELECLGLRSIDSFNARCADRLQAVNARLRECEDGTSAVALDGEWHAALMELSGNQVLTELTAQLRVRAKLYEHTFLAEAGRALESAAEHDRIALLASEGHRAEAEQVLRQNWMKMVQFFEKRLEH